MVQKAQPVNLGPYKANTYVVGDVRDLLRQLPDDSIDCVVTSPPYYGLRDYGIEPSVWGGRPDCAHRWGDELRVHKGGPHGDGVLRGGSRAVVDAQAAVKDIRAGRFCAECGAWCGHLGLEPTWVLYVEHMVDVFREVNRVLRGAGTLWLNLGDCYATGAGAVGGCPGGGAQGDKWRGNRGERLGNGRGDQPEEGRAKTQGNQAIGPMTQPNRLPQPGLKPKDLMGIPWRVAFALQDAGWYLRSEIIWHKPNPMPESVVDRPTKGHEQVFLFSKSERYFYDSAAIAEDASRAGDVPGGGAGHIEYIPGRRNHNKDGLADCSQRPVAEKRNRRTVWTIATEPTPDAHFATMPTKLAQPCILAGCPRGGVVLDPFGGSGTTGKVAEDNGRQWLLFDRSPEYAEIAKRRTAQVGLLGRCANES